ncbi:hypothetical protein [Pyrinomonas methylaliphatogenes]|uniref:hypothetical protein n=1 Tax=Pyrinomonas methylaliphatogenes TaxID=454194 RepID=UPI0012FDA065|nr:hypothetical protein [Pyrinomonas methylaliphatogenes]MBX5477908.1 hypothetical protein [Pyrinomonas methylaliphatogenes]
MSSISGFADWPAKELSQSADSTISAFARSECFVNIMSKRLVEQQTVNHSLNQNVSSAS